MSRRTDLCHGHYRSRAREGRGISVIPEAETRPETVSNMSTTCERGLGAARPFTADIASQYVTADKPGATATFTIISPKTNPNSSTASQTAPSHIWMIFDHGVKLPGDHDL